ncbi:MAG: dethiobiotin synthase [Bacteroidia bacterium]|nr:dethiobiotin synthase [Bacteroidia bacterium]
MFKAIGVVGIHTGIGKTVASAVLAKAWNMDYWKPIQAGSLDSSDSIMVQQWSGQFVHPERYLLNEASSPHAAAKKEQVQIQLSDFVLPSSQRSILVETAGGLFSPVNDEFTMLDLVKHLQLPVVVVMANYLGSINHSMLTLEVLKQHKIKIAGLVFCGETNKESEAFILQHTRHRVIARIPFVNPISKEFITQQASQLLPETEIWSTH